MDQVIAKRINGQLFKIDGDLPKLDKDFTYEVSEKAFDYRTRSMQWRTVTYHLYETLDIEGFYFRAGFAAYILFHYNDKLDSHSKLVLSQYIHANIDYQFTDLRPYQVEDMKTLLRFKRGLFSVYTGYGKTQIIAKLVEYIVKVRKERVLVIAPTSKALEEAQWRIEQVAGLTCGYFDYEADYNAINTNGFLRSQMYDITNPYWKTVKWLIADEVEYCLSEGAMEMMSLLTEVEYVYGFSGTADKSRADRVTMRQGNTEIVQRNKNLIEWFGFSLVYHKPSDFSINLVNIRTSMFNDLKQLRVSDEGEMYSEVILKLFIDKRFCEGLRKIVEKEKQGIYIPMGRLEVIYHWLENVFIWKGGTIVNICGEGIQVWSEGALVRNIELDELKEMVDRDEVEVIVGTKSSYRAIDLPKLHKILPLTSQAASAVLQQIGRVARGRKFDIFNLIPSIYVTIYSGDLKERTKLIKNYYSECNLTEITRKESEYGIF